MARSIHTNGISISKGQNVLTKLVISKLPSGTVIDIPVYVHRAEQEGPVLLLMAGMHGDEVNGIEVIRRMLRRKMLYPLKGTIIAVPILNIYGFLNFSREVPDGKDVNRSFPGNMQGSLASRVAHKFMKEVMPLIDYGIDFHTGGASRTNYPQVRCLMSDEQNQKLAHAFAAPFIMNANHRPGSLRKEAFRQGKRILVYECGESLRFDEEGIKRAIEGTTRVMHMLNMAETSVPPLSPSVICQKSTWVRAKNAGLFRSTIKSGEYIKKNQLVGTITDPYGELEVKLKAPVSGYVIGLNHMPVVNQGDALLHIGLTASSEVLQDEGEGE